MSTHLFLAIVILCTVPLPVSKGEENPCEGLTLGGCENILAVWMFGDMTTPVFGLSISKVFENFREGRNSPQNRQLPVFVRYSCGIA